MNWLERYSLGPWGWKYGLLTSVTITAIESCARWLTLEFDPGPPFLYYIPGYWISSLVGGLIPGVFSAITALCVAKLLFIPQFEINTEIRGLLNMSNGIAFAVAIHYFQRTTLDLKKANYTALIFKRELNHRVGNFLQTVQAVCMMHKVQHPTNESLDAIYHKLHSLNQVHNVLQNESPTFDANKIKEVVGVILDDRNCQIDVDANLEIARDQVQPLMLIINELALNTFKHQPNDKDCLITVHLTREKNQNILIYCDQGKGKPEPGKGLGVRIIEAMAQQLGGSVEFNENPKARIVFPA